MDLKSKACGKKLCMRAQNAVPSAQLVVKFSILMPSYSRTLHWHQMRLASICGDIIFMPEPDGRVMPSSRATPACVAIPPRFELGFKHGDGFLISSISPAMFFKNKLCMFFSSMCFSFMLILDILIDR